MFNFFRRKAPIRMSHPIWRYDFEELRRKGKPTDEASVQNMILMSFAYVHEEMARKLCRQGYATYGRGAIVHVPDVVRGGALTPSQIPSRQFYVSKSQAIETLPGLVGNQIVETLCQDMDSYSLIGNTSQP